MPIDPRPGAQYDPWVEGWKDFQNNNHDGVPADNELADVQGMFVRLVNVNDPEDVQYFWAMVLGGYDNWMEWYLYIDSLLEMYGGQLS
jgi:hypothetical protein